MSTIAINPFEVRQKQAIRQAVNPLDKSTVVSIFPKFIKETKETLQPNTFCIEAGSYEKPALLVVGPSSWFREVDEHAPLVEIPISSIVIAKSIVEDYISSLLAYRKGSAHPGLFYMPGEFKSLDALKKNTDFLILLAKAKQLQDQWYQDLVAMADRDWARGNGNPLAISSDMKMAANELQIKDKPWMKDFTNMKMINCKACDFRIMPHVIVCPNCKLILDPVKAKEMGLQFAS